MSTTHATARAPCTQTLTGGVGRFGRYHRSAARRFRMGYGRKERARSTPPRCWSMPVASPNISITRSDGGGSAKVLQSLGPNSLCVTFSHIGSERYIKHSLGTDLANIPGQSPHRSLPPFDSPVPHSLPTPRWPSFSPLLRLCCPPFW